MEFEKLLFNIFNNNYKNNDNINNDNINNDNINNDNINNDIKNKYKNEILIIGDMIDYRKRMNFNYIKFFDYLKYNLDNFNLIYVGPGIDNFKINESIYTIIDKYCKTKNPILYFCEIKSGSLIKDVDKYNNSIKIFDFEDVVNRVDIMINIIKTINFDYILYKCDCNEVNNLMNMFQYIKFIRYDHYIDNNIFKDMEYNKIYDIICYGYIDKNYYPFRYRLFNLLNKQNDMKIKIINHPGYGYNRNHDIIGNKLCEEINKSKIAIVTPSNLEFFVKKYSEISLCGCCMAGRLPKKNGEKYENCLIELNENMNDNEIINKLKFYLNNDNERLKLIEKSKKIAEENYTYEVGLKVMDEIFTKFI